METETTNQNNAIPFQNLFLTKGFITGKNEPWRYVLGIIIAAVGYFVFRSIIMFPLMNAALNNGVLMNEIIQNPNIIFSPEKTGINKSVLLAIMMGMFVFTLLFFWLAIKFIQKKPLSSVITGFDRIRWSHYFFAFLVWGLLLIGLTVVSYLISPQDMVLQFNPSAFVILVIVAVVFIPIQTATEEILFRGYLMQGLGIGLKNGIFPLIITSILFGLMHGTNPEAQAHGFLIMMPYYILFGAFLGVLTLLDEGAELAMGIHCANNLFSSLLVCSKNSVLQTDAIFYTTVENPSGEFFIWIIMALVCFIILRKKYQLTNWSLILR